MSYSLIPKYTDHIYQQRIPMREQVLTYQKCKKMIHRQQRLRLIKRLLFVLILIAVTIQYREAMAETELPSINSDTLSVKQSTPGSIDGFAAISESCFSCHRTLVADPKTVEINLDFKLARHTPVQKRRKNFSF